MTIYAVHLAFCPAWILRAGLERYRETQGVDATHVIVDQHYPLNRVDNRRELRALAAEFGAFWADSGGDLGLHRGFNKMLQALPAEPGDLIMVYDPDSFPLESGWDLALSAVMMADESIAYLGLSSDRTFETPGRSWYDEWINGLSVAFPNGPVQINVACWRYSFLRRAGGLRENCEYYGHLEAPMFLEAERQGMRHGYLRNFTEDFRLTTMHDPEYEAYKIAHAHTQHWPGDFKSFLEAGCPGPTKD